MSQCDPKPKANRQIFMDVSDLNAENMEYT